MCVYIWYNDMHTDMVYPHTSYTWVIQIKIVKAKHKNFPKA